MLDFLMGFGTCFRCNGILYKRFKISHNKKIECKYNVQIDWHFGYSFYVNLERMYLELRYYLESVRVCKINAEKNLIFRGYHNTYRRVPTQLLVNSLRRAYCLEITLKLFHKKTSEHLHSYFVETTICCEP